MPIYGLSVPFHVSNIKNVNKTDDYIRLNFYTPEAPSDIKNDEAKNLIHIKEISYRCNNQNNLSTVVRLIKESRKRVVSSQNAAREAATLVAQEDLVLSRGKVPRLADVFVRPNMGRRTIGTLEAHTNGFRFSAKSAKTDARIDIMYNNIKHAFFQEAQNDYCVIIHFHLKNAIMIGKKKSYVKLQIFFLLYSKLILFFSKDVQFATEVIEASTALETRRYDENEFDEEQREYANKKRLNNEFKNFVLAVEEKVTGLEFDSPYQDLSFYGVPNRSSVLLSPTVHCLVNISEVPFFVATLSDVEIAYFERVQV